jgi:hypothetical protein
MMKISSFYERNFIMSNKIVFFALLSGSTLLASSHPTAAATSSSSLTIEKIDQAFYEALDITIGRYLEKKPVSLVFVDTNALSPEDKSLQQKGHHWIAENAQKIPTLHFYINSPSMVFQAWNERCSSLHELRKDADFHKVVTWAATKMQEIVENPKHEIRNTPSMSISLSSSSQQIENQNS